jgi:hypothetical protein
MLFLPTYKLQEKTNEVECVDEKVDIIYNTNVDKY